MNSLNIVRFYTTELEAKEALAVAAYGRPSGGFSYFCFLNQF